MRTDDDTDIITIVGTEIDGLMTALLLKHNFPTKLIRVIHGFTDWECRTPSQSSGYMFKEQFLNRLNLNEHDFMIKTDATYTAGSYYSGFGKIDFPNHLGSYPLFYSHNEYHCFQGYILGWKQLKNKWLAPNHFYDGDIPLIQDNFPMSYTFDTAKFRDYLLELCELNGVYIDKAIYTRVELDNHQQIKRLHGTDGNYYTSDWWIDNTGPRRLLSSFIDFKWKSWEAHTPASSHIYFETPAMEEYNLFTFYKALDIGYLWRAPLYGRTANGITHNYELQSKNGPDIHKVLEKIYKHPIEYKVKSNKYPVGCFDKMWNGNIILIGQSSSLLEPLEGLNVMLSLLQTNCLINALPSKDKKSVNEDYNDLMDNILSYVQMHYLTQRKEPFWKKEIKQTDFLKEMLPRWQVRLPRDRDFTHRLKMFGPLSFINLIAGLDLYTKARYEEEARLYSYGQRVWISKELKKTKDWEESCLRMSHKEMLKLIHTKNLKNTERTIY